MAKAQVVHNFDCKAGVDSEARRVIGVRLEELAANHGRIAGSDDSVAIHDLRISAKRLRYSLETFAFCFPEADLDAMANQVRGLQDVLGRIHDLDVLVAMLVERIECLDGAVRRAVLDLLRQRRQEEGLSRLLGDGEDKRRQLGLYEVIGAKLSERAERYTEFEALWQRWEERGVLRAMEALVATGTDVISAAQTGS